MAVLFQLKKVPGGEMRFPNHYFYVRMLAINIPLIVVMMVASAISIGFLGEFALFALLMGWLAARECSGIPVWIHVIAFSLCLVVEFQAIYGLINEIPDSFLWMIVILTIKLLLLEMAVTKYIFNHNVVAMQYLTGFSVLLNIFGFINMFYIGWQDNLLIMLLLVYELILVLLWMSLIDLAQKNRDRIR